MPKQVISLKQLSDGSGGGWRSARISLCFVGGCGYVRGDGKGCVGGVGGGEEGGWCRSEERCRVGLRGRKWDG